MTTKFGLNSSKALISKSDLLTWINDLLKVELTKIEELGSGSIYCQLFDVIYPGQVPLTKVKWNAKLENDFLFNFRILQQAFDSLKLNKLVQIEKLVKAKYQDNLEFAQWMKRFFEINCKEKGKGYDALARRNYIQPEFQWIKKGAPPKYTLVYSHNSKAAGTCYSVNINDKNSDAPDSQEMSNDISGFSGEFINKKVKLNNENESQINQQQNQQQQQQKQQLVQQYNQECKFFSKKPLESSISQNMANNQIQTNQQDGKPSLTESESIVYLQKIKDVINNCEGLTALFTINKIKDILVSK